PMRAWRAFIPSPVRVSTWPVSPWRVALSDARCFPSSVRGPVDFCAFRRLARSWASEGGRRTEVGRLGDVSAGRDGWLACGFFLVDMEDPFACEGKGKPQPNSEPDRRKLLMWKRKK